MRKKDVAGGGSGDKDQGHAELPSGRRRKGDAGPFEALRALRDEISRKTEEAPSSPKPASKSALLPRDPARSASSARGGSSTRGADEDDSLALHRLFAGVTPLGKAPGRIPRQRIERSPSIERVAETGQRDAAADADAVHEHIRALVDEGARFEVSDDGMRVEGRRAGVPADAVRKLRRGVLTIDARVDLHGMSALQARGHLELFLRTMRSRGERCVLVIHGKGEHSPAGVGVLRGEIAAWLSQGRASEHVAAFVTAQRDDGGEGAVYVLLRR